MEDTLLIEAESIQNDGKCPVCQTWSQRLNGHYTRHPQDLPCACYNVQLQLRVPRFFCDNAMCDRRSERLTTQQLQIGLVSSGEVGSRLLQAFNMKTSPDTLLRLVREAPEIQHQTPRVLGVDDWAKCKGQTYGTILASRY